MWKANQETIYFFLKTYFGNYSHPTNKSESSDFKSDKTHRLDPHVYLIFFSSFNPVEAD